MSLLFCVMVDVSLHLYDFSSLKMFTLRPGTLLINSMPPRTTHLQPLWRHLQCRFKQQEKLRYLHLDYQSVDHYFQLNQNHRLISMHPSRFLYMHCNPVVHRDTRGNQVTNQHVGYSHKSTAFIGFILKVDTVDVLGLKQQLLCISRAVRCDIGIS